MTLIGEHLNGALVILVNASLSWRFGWLIDDGRFGTAKAGMGTLQVLDNLVRSYHLNLLLLPASRAHVRYALRRAILRLAIVKSAILSRFLIFSSFAFQIRLSLIVGGRTQNLIKITRRWLTHLQYR